MPSNCLRQLSMLSMSQGSCITLIFVHVCLIYLLKISKVLFRLFRIFNFGDFLYHFGQVSNRHFGHFAETFVPTNKISTDSDTNIYENCSFTAHSRFHRFNDEKITEILSSSVLTRRINEKSRNPHNVE